MKTSTPLLLLWALALPTLALAADVPHAPGKFSVPANYVKKFPLDQISQTELVLEWGAPNVLIRGEATGEDLLVYEIQWFPGETAVVTAFVDDGLVHDLVIRWGARTYRASEAQR